MGKFISSLGGLTLHFLLISDVQACQGPPSTYSSTVLSRRGQTVNHVAIGDYVFEDMFEDPKTSSEPYYPVLNVFKGGQVVRTITPDEIPVDAVDCEGQTCDVVKAQDSSYEYKYGPCFGGGIFGGPSFLAATGVDPGFFFYVVTQPPMLTPDPTIVVYYAEIDTDVIMRIGSISASSIYGGKLSPGDEEFIAYRAGYTHRTDSVGVTLRIMRISDGHEVELPDEMNLPTDTYGYYSIHDYKWIDGQTLQLVLYAYKTYPGPDETSDGADEQVVTYVIPPPDYEVVNAVVSSRPKSSKHLQGSRRESRVKHKKTHVHSAD